MNAKQAMFQNLIIAIADMSNLKRADMRQLLEEASPEQRQILKREVMRLHSIMNLNDEPYIGKELRDGSVIAGIEENEGRVIRVLVDGSGRHEWCETLAAK